MPMTEINISSSRNSVFNESKGIKINYATIDANNLKNSYTTNNTSDRFNYKQVDNSKKIFLNFSYKEAQSSEYVTSKKIYGEITNNNLGKVYIDPFSDKESISQVNVSHKTRKRAVNSFNSFNGDIHYEEHKCLPFYDKVNPINENNLLLENFEDEKFDYAFTFNYFNFTFRGGRIDAFSNISKIQMHEAAVDAEKGFSFSDLGKSKSAFKENNTITNKYRKDDDIVFPYSDSIDKAYLTDNKTVKKLDKLNYIYNADDGTYSEDSSTNVLTPYFVSSSDARYFVYEEKNITPYRDITSKNNFWWIQSNKYKFTDVDINDKILDIRNKNDIFIEDLIYSSHGKDINKEYSAGRDSIGFYESID